MTDLDEELNRAAKHLADDIDFEIMTYHLVSDGWTKVVLAPMSTEHSQEIDRWVETRSKRQVYTRGLVFLFKEAKDATWFALKFGGPQYE